MEFFYRYFKNRMHVMDTGEAAVLCPFPHKDDRGHSYYETVPSAHINLEKSLFHCKVCGEGMSEAAFLSKVQGITYKDALVLLRELEKTEGTADGWEQYKLNLENSPATLQFVEELGLTSVKDELQLGFDGEGVLFPAYVYGEILDVRSYAPDRQTPDGRIVKVTSRKGAKALPLPFDLWIEDDRPTVLCAGEKDMAIARVYGFNSLSFTGGEQSFPKMFKASFKNKTIFIVYDNDTAGREGAKKIASMLKDAGAFPHVVTGHYDVCKEKGEDLWDFFKKHGKTAEDLQDILDKTPEFSEADHMEERAKRVPRLTLSEALQGRYAGQIVSSRITVIATYEETMYAPEYVEFEKSKYGRETGEWNPGEKSEWVLDESTAENVLLLVDSGLKEAEIHKNLLRFGRVPPKEPDISKRVRSTIDVTKAVVSDDLESGTLKSNESVDMRELLVYVIGDTLKAGQKYDITYKPVAHPLKGQQVVGVVIGTERAGTTADAFKVTPKVIESLACFQVPPGQTVTQKMKELYERSKAFIGVEARADVMFASDLFYHTPLYFNFGERRERAYLDAMIIGDPRTGKSQTVKAMMEMYELGVFTSLKTATAAGLLGGSDQTSGGWKTKLGLLPRNHRGAVIMEEFSGGGQDIVGKLTEMRSSNRVRLTRVNGAVDVPAMVRMLSISNPQTGPGGQSTPIRQYAHGIKVLLDLIGAAEDIARYDFFLLVDEPDHYTSPLQHFDGEPISKESYMNRVRWIWSREPEQIVMSEHVMQYIVEHAAVLNETYNTHIKIFGPEAWKKLARIAIATAALVCSIDETGERLIVLEDHVRWAKNFLIRLYDNKIFRLKEYVHEQRKVSQIDEMSIKLLEQMYHNNPMMLEQLAMSNGMSQKQLQMASGLDNKQFNVEMGQLFRYGFCEFQSDRIVPTPRFRGSLAKIDKVPEMPKLGEV